MSDQFLHSGYARKKFFYARVLLICAFERCATFVAEERLSDARVDFGRSSAHKGGQKFSERLRIDVFVPHLRRGAVRELASQ